MAPRFPRIGTRPMTDDRPMPRTPGAARPGVGDRPRRSPFVYSATDRVRFDALGRAWDVAAEQRRRLELELARIAELERRTLAEMQDAGAPLRDIAVRIGRSHTYVATEIRRYRESQLPSPDFSG